MRHRSLAEAVR